MRTSIEVSIDLSAQELLSLPAPAAMAKVDDICVDDICALDPLPLAQAPAANSSHLPPANVLPPAADDTIEIELTAEQMDALLSQ